MFKKALSAASAISVLPTVAHHSQSSWFNSTNPTYPGHCVGGG